MGEAPCTYNVELTLFDESKQQQVALAGAKFSHLLGLHYAALPGDNKPPFAFNPEIFINDFSRFRMTPDLGTKILIIASKGEEPVVAMYGAAQPDLMTGIRTLTVEHMYVQVGHDEAARQVDTFARQLAQAYRCEDYINSHWSEP